MWKATSMSQLHAESATAAAIKSTAHLLRVAHAALKSGDDKSETNKAAKDAFHLWINSAAPSHSVGPNLSGPNFSKEVETIAAAIVKAQVGNALTDATTSGNVEAFVEELFSNTTVPSNQSAELVPQVAGVLQTESTGAACSSCDLVPCGQCQQGCQHSLCSSNGATSKNGCANKNHARLPTSCNEPVQIPYSATTGPEGTQVAATTPQSKHLVPRYTPGCCASGRLPYCAVCTLY